MTIEFDFSEDGFDMPPSDAGHYRVKISELSGYETSNGNPRMSIQATIMDGPFKGYTIKDGLNFPAGPKARQIRKFWDQFFVACGLTPQEVRSVFTKNFDTIDDAVGMVRDAILGSEAHVYFTPRPPDGGYSNCEWQSQAKAEVATKSVKEGRSTDKSDELSQFLNM